MIEKAKLSEVILSQNRQYQQLYQNSGVKRNCTIEPLKNFATIVTGIRRCGKSTLLRQYLSGKKPVYYIHFEDIRLASFELKDFEKLEDIFLNELGQSEIYFLDEIQNVEGWEIYVRSLLDSGKKVFITGSNATLMSSEPGTRLTGRNIRYELFPFDFNEFCRAKEKERNSAEFEKYLSGGGFPEYVLRKDERILQALLNDIIYRDILVRNKIRDEGVVKNIITYMLSNVGNETSFNKIGELFGVAPNTVISIVNALEDAYFIFVLNKFDYSLKKQQRNPKKVYCVDNGFITHASFQFSGNKGSLLENLVFIELRRRGYELYYHKDKHECDFVVKEGVRITKAFQVCYELNDDNFKRETDGLIEAMEEYDLDFGVILTFDQEDEFDFDNRKVAVIPIRNYDF
jgi:predicted AAA+ superfamily ATPase